MDEPEPEEKVSKKIKASLGDPKDWN